MIITGKNGRKVDLKKISNIILFDSSSNVEDLQKILNDFTKIISFDYESHKILDQNGIEHEISDRYVTRDNLVNVQNNCYHFAKWFENDEFIKLLDYEGINLGSLIQVELNYFLVSFVKKLVEVGKVFDTYPTSSFITSPFLYDFIKLHTDSIMHLNEEHSSQTFYYDTVKIPVKIGGHNFTLHISNSQFSKLKKTFEIILTVLFGPRKIDERKKSTLIVEFDPIRYKKIFDNLPDTPINLLVFNRRRPTIWNTKSFFTIKHSGCSVITSYLLNDNVARKRIKANSESVYKKIQSIWELDNFFKSFFSINNISFWEPLKSKFKELLIKRIDEAIPEIELTKRIFEKYRLDSVLVWSEIGLTEQIVVKLAKRFGIKIVLFQHGLFYDSGSEGAYNMNKFQGVYPIDADKYVVWGKIEEKHQLKSGTSKDKLVVLGTPLYDGFFDLESDYHTNYVLLATSGPVKENALDLTIETIEKNRQTIKKICTVVAKMNKKLVIRIHPSQDEFDPTELAKEISSNIIISKTGSIAQLAKSCDVFVMIDTSTVMLDAHLLKKPVISVVVKDSDYGIPSVMRESCMLTNADNFEEIFCKVLSDEIFRKSLIKKGTSYVNEYLVNQGKASQKLLQFLANI